MYDVWCVVASFWVVCADMAAQYTVPDPSTPSKMFMNYQGLASYLSSGGQQHTHTRIHTHTHTQINGGYNGTIKTRPSAQRLQKSPLSLSLSSAGDNYWVIDTDYDTYALTYACRALRDDGTCEDGYSLVFSRNPRGLPPAIQRLLRQKQEEICMGGQFQPVLQSGAC